MLEGGDLSRSEADVQGRARERARGGGASADARLAAPSHLSTSPGLGTT